MLGSGDERPATVLLTEQQLVERPPELVAIHHEAVMAFGDRSRAVLHDDPVVDARVADGRVDVGSQRLHRRLRIRGARLQLAARRQRSETRQDAAVLATHGERLGGQLIGEIRFGKF